jgi:hypothetical protein
MLDLKCQEFWSLVWNSTFSSGIFFKAGKLAIASNHLHGFAGKPARPCKRCKLIGLNFQRVSLPTSAGIQTLKIMIKIHNFFFALSSWFFALSSWFFALSKLAQNGKVQKYLNFRGS